jgi:hypothetical protein
MRIRFAWISYCQLLLPCTRVSCKEGHSGLADKVQTNLNTGDDEHDGRLFVSAANTVTQAARMNSINHRDLTVHFHFGASMTKLLF